MAVGVGGCLAAGRRDGQRHTRGPRGGGHLPGPVLGTDATLVNCHAEKEQVAATYKRSFGYHPLLCFPDNTSETLAGMLRPGNAVASTAARPPPRHRHPHPHPTTPEKPKAFSWPTCAPCATGLYGQRLCPVIGGDEG
ncbi:transposase [Streptomyces sp. GD-15H]|uniref:transposase n=1 Tax=Streptomyces sp. GD-15H TaxID=3129112 RepID=UPI00324F2FBD